MEHGSTPGKEEPVFQCDFGKLGIQICYDMDFDYGWRELARQGAELVAWPTQSPQTSQPACARQTEPLLHRLQHLAEQRFHLRTDGQNRFRR